MRIFHCDHCGQPVFFENTLCGRCGHRLAYLPDLKLIASLDPATGPGKAGANGKGGETGNGTGTGTADLWTCPIPRAAGRRYRLCANYAKHNVCNWAVPEEDQNPLCASCRLTRVIPDLSQPGNEVAWARLEAAKRRLMYSLIELRLPIVGKGQDPVRGLSFHFLGDPPGGPVVLTGHDNGLITVNIVEADDVERERRRVSMHEPYRTLLGHFRHEIGHYYWDLLVSGSPRLDACRQMFGDERADYGEALKRHYAEGPKASWREAFVSDYASVHPWEDWAETWAHYLHMTDTLETAAVCGMSLEPSRPDEPSMPKPAPKPPYSQTFDEIIGNWFPLTYALNNLNRGMGLGDAYPFVLKPPAIEKLRFVHETICQSTCGEDEGGRPGDRAEHVPVPEAVPTGGAVVGEPVR